MKARKVAKQKETELCLKRGLRRNKKNERYANLTRKMWPNIDLVYTYTQRERVLKMKALQSEEEQWERKRGRGQIAFEGWLKVRVC